MADPGPASSQTVDDLTAIVSPEKVSPTTTVPESDEPSGGDTLNPYKQCEENKEDNSADHATETAQSTSVDAAATSPHQSEKVRPKSKRKKRCSRESGEDFVSLSSDSDNQVQSGKRRASSPPTDVLVDPSSDWTIGSDYVVRLSNDSNKSASGNYKTEDGSGAKSITEGKRSGKRLNRTRSKSCASPRQSKTRTSKKRKQIDDIDTDSSDASVKIMNMTPYGSGDSDDDDELPAALTPSGNRKLNPSVGDIVWVKYKKEPFWPAVVKRVSSKRVHRQRRVTVVFIGNMFSKDVQRITVNITPLVLRPFGQENSQLKEAGLNSDSKEEFLKAVERTEWYVYKRLSDPTLPPPLKFFMPDSQETTDSDSGDASSMSSLQMTRLSSSTDGVSDDNDDNNEAVLAPDTSSPQQPVVMSAKLESSLRRIKQQNEKYVDFIKSDTTKSYLLGVMNEEIDSECHKNFKLGDHHGASQYGFGPLEDEEQRLAVLKTLEEYYKLAFPQVLVSNFSYIMAVLLPEALVFSLRKVGRLSKENAWKRYDRGPRYYKEQRRLFHEDILRSASSLSAEEKKQHQERHKMAAQKFLSQNNL